MCVEEGQGEAGEENRVASQLYSARWMKLDIPLTGGPPPRPSRKSSVNTELNRPVIWGAWVTRWVELLTSAQVTISRFTSSSPTSGSVLTAPSLEPASDSASPSLSAPPQLSLSLSKINKHLKNCHKNFFKNFK